MTITRGDHSLKRVTGGPVLGKKGQNGQFGSKLGQRGNIWVKVVLKGSHRGLKSTLLMKISSDCPETLENLKMCRHLAQAAGYPTA